MQSHTKRISEAALSCEDNFTDNSTLTDGSSSKTWGPFQGVMTNLIPKALLNEESFSCASNCFNLVPKNLVLVGSGSAVNFMIDFMSFMLEVRQSIMEIRINQLKCILLYSTRDVSLYQWSVEAIHELLESIKEEGPKDDFVLEESLEIDVVISYTARRNLDNDDAEAAGAFDVTMKAMASMVKLVDGRINYEKEIQRIVLYFVKDLCKSQT